MRKKDAFTLVELLGVIVVLAILALITIPIISNVINDVRIKALQNSAYGLIEAGNLYYAQYGTNSNLRFDINNNLVSSTDTTNLLKYKGSVKEVTVILDRKGQVTVCITDGKNSAYKNYNKSKVTISKGKVCSIKENSSIVYLDDEATIDYLDNTQLTSELADLKEEVKSIKDNFLDKTYPVGSIYITMTENTVSKVEEKFGGTWEQIESGYMLRSTDVTSGTTGGSSTATFTPAGTVGDTTLLESQMPRHSHKNLHWGSEYGTIFVFSHNNGGNDTALDFSSDAVNPWNYDVDLSSTNRIVTEPEGGDQPHTHTFTGTSTTINTVSPYITVYMYKRVS